MFTYEKQRQLAKYACKMFNFKNSSPKNNDGMRCEETKSDSKIMCLTIIEMKSNQKCNPEMVIGMLEIWGIMGNTEIYVQY